MKKYYVEIDGIKIEVSKEISDVVNENAGETRHERYVIDELSKKHESSLEYLLSCGIPLDKLILFKPDSPEEDILTREKHQILYDAINSLSKLEKKIIVLIFFYDMTETEVSIMLDFSQQYISKVKLKALTKLKSIFLRLFF